MYKADMRRQEQQSTFADYRDYLLSLGMKAEIAPLFFPLYEQDSPIDNKSNQFNLTTKRFTQGEIEKILLTKIILRYTVGWRIVLVIMVLFLLLSGA